MRVRPFAAALLAIMLATAPGLAFARAGAGSSMGSRGSFTYSAPPATRTAPSAAEPMQRSLTAPPAYSPGLARQFSQLPRLAGGRLSYRG